MFSVAQTTFDCSNIIQIFTRFVNSDFSRRRFTAIAHTRNARHLHTEEVLKIPLFDFACTTFAR